MAATISYVNGFKIKITPAKNLEVEKKIMEEPFKGNNWACYCNECTFRCEQCNKIACMCICDEIEKLWKD